MKNRERAISAGRGALRCLLSLLLASLIPVSVPSAFAQGTISTQVQISAPVGTDTFDTGMLSIYFDGALLGTKDQTTHGTVDFPIPNLVRGTDHTLTIAASEYDLSKDNQFGFVVVTSPDTLYFTSDNGVPVTNPFSEGGSRIVQSNGQVWTFTLHVAGPGCGLNNLSLSPVRVTGGVAAPGGATGTVTFDCPLSAGVGVALASSISALAKVPVAITVPAGNTPTATFQIETTAVPEDTGVFITATADNVTRTARLTILAPTLKDMFLNPSVGSIKGDFEVFGTVTLTGPAPAAGLTVTFDSTDTNVAKERDGSRFIPGREMTARFDIQTFKVTTATAVTIDAALNGVRQGSVSFIVVPTAPLLCVFGQDGNVAGLDFHEVGLDQTPVQTVQVENCGDELVHISSVNDTPEFKVLNNGVPIDLQPGMGHAYKVAFHPQALGPRAFDLSFTTDDPAINENVKIPLKGVGVPSGAAVDKAEQGVEDLISEEAGLPESTPGEEEIDLSDVTLGEVEADLDGSGGASMQSVSRQARLSSTRHPNIAAAIRDLKRFIQQINQLLAQGLIPSLGRRLIAEAQAIIGLLGGTDTTVPAIPGPAISPPPVIVLPSQADPHLDAIVVDRGPVGQRAIIHGHGFADVQGSSFVLLGGHQIPVLGWTANAINVFINPLAYNQGALPLDIAYPIQVVAPDAGTKSNTVSFFLTSGPLAAQ